MPISSACLVFDGACPPHQPGARAATEPLIHQSPCSWQETDPRGKIPAGRLEPRWLTGQQREREERQVECTGPLQINKGERLWGELEDVRVAVCETDWRFVCVWYCLRYNN